MKLKEAVRRLSDAGIENAKGEARLMFEIFGEIPKYMLVSDECECESEALSDALMRRCTREPLQYITREVEFYKERYKVTPDCLIPRPDTEVLVDYAVKNLPRGAVFLDLCTGSGCVAISTLKNTEDTRALAYDISEGAVRLAAENASANGVKERFSASVLDLMRETPEVSGIYAVLSNPPYISDAVYPELEAEIFHEPRCAFVGGPDGADFYRRFIPIYRDLIDGSGFLAFEIGYDQGELMQGLADEHKMTLDIIKDLSGNDRVAVFKRQ